MTESKDTIKFWTFLTVMLLGVAVAVTLIDLTIKASILAEAAKMRAAIEDWEVRNGQEVSGRIDERNSPDPTNNGHLPGDVLATGDARMEAGSADKPAPKQAQSRTRNGRFASPSDGD